VPEVDADLAQAARKGDGKLPDGFARLRTTWSPPMRRPPSRPASAAKRHFVLHLGVQGAWSSSTTAAGRFSTWLPGTCTRPRSSGAVRSRLDRAVRPARRPGDGHRALRVSASGLLRSGQWQQPPGQEGRRSPTRPVAETRPRPRAGGRELTQPSEGRLLGDSAQGSHARDFADFGEVEARLLAFERRYEQSAAPFEWKLTRTDRALLRKEARRQARLPGSCLRSHRS